MAANLWSLRLDTNRKVATRVTTAAAKSRSNPTNAPAKKVTIMAMGVVRPGNPFTYLM